MIPPYLEQLEDKVRRAALSRRYRDVPPLTAEFAVAVEGYSLQFPSGDPRAREAARRLIDLLSWSLVMMKGSRAACAAELSRVRTANRYSGRAHAPRAAHPNVNLSA